MEDPNTGPGACREETFLSQKMAHPDSLEQALGRILVPNEGNRLQRLG